MKTRFGIAVVLGIVAVAPSALADDVKVLIAGPKKDPIAARLEKEMVALGFTPIDAGTLDDCAKKSVMEAVQSSEARAALCSDGTQVGVWTDDGNELKLRDVVAPQEKGPHVHDQVAMRAAEVARANIAFREPEPPPPSALRPQPLMSGENWDEFEQQDRPPPVPPPKFVNRFSASFGVGMMAGAHSTQNVFSGELAYGIHRRFSLTLRADLNAGETSNTYSAVATPTDQSDIHLRTGMAGAGIQVPLMPRNERFVPRVGASLGIAWLHATKEAGPIVDANGNTTGTATPTSDTVFAPAGWLSGGVSVGLVGPVRFDLDGLFGSAIGALTVREQGIALAQIGTPIFAFAGRLEWTIQ
jgi:hypothetical protein